MTQKTVWAAYFSPTGTTKKMVSAIAKNLAESLGMALKERDFTLPEARCEAMRFTAEDMVVLGTPVYAGRVPNVLLKYLDTLEGNGALGIPVAMFGNRSYDDALIELRDIMQDHGFHTIAAGAFVGEHSFSTTLGGGRPDEIDLRLAAAFSEGIVNKLLRQEIPEGPVPVKGTPKPYNGYYQPRDLAGNPVDIRKVKPVTGDSCIDCKVCVRVCPMGSIAPEDVRQYVGICIKCGACIKKCPVQARYYDDPRYIYHKEELEEGFARRAEPEYFF